MAETRWGCRVKKSQNLHIYSGVKWDFKLFKHDQEYRLKVYV